MITNILNARNAKNNSKILANQPQASYKGSLPKEAITSIESRTKLPQDSFQFSLASNLIKSINFSPITERIIQCTRDNNSIGKVDAQLFKAHTGMNLLSPTNINLSPFKFGIDEILKLKKAGKFPDEIKHVLIGHGQGDSTSGTWVFTHAKKIKVLDYLKQNLLPGEKVLVLTCESKGKSPIGKPGIGQVVYCPLNKDDKPGKIVEVGKGIIGHFVNGETTYYK